MKSRAIFIILSARNIINFTYYIGLTKKNF